MGLVELCFKLRNRNVTERKNANDEKEVSTPEEKTLRRRGPRRVLPGDEFQGKLTFAAGKD
jgi:hypothetical protein